MGLRRYREREAEIEQSTRVFQSFCEELEEKQDAKYFSILDWHETVEIDTNGYGTIRAWVTIKAGEKEVSSFWQKRGYAGKKRGVKLEYIKLARMAAGVFSVQQASDGAKQT